MSWGELSGIVKVVPLSQGSSRAADRQYSRFDSPMSSTRRLLAHEVSQLQAREVLLEADFRESQLRLDGLPKSGAVPASPDLVLTLRGTPHGDLRYACSTYSKWEDNLRAIALSLEALRAVGRWRVLKRGEQYVGSKQLTSGTGPGDGDPVRGAELIRAAGGVPEALKAAHPDHGGNPDDFRDVIAARDQGHR